VSPSKKFLCSHQRDPEVGKEFVNVVDIQKEEFVCQIDITKSKKRITHRKATSLFYDEANHLLFVGFNSGEIECWASH